MITVQRERVADIMEEIVPILVHHWTEVEKDNGVPSLNPSFDQYLEMDDQGFSVMIIARDEGEMVGYMLDICSHNMHYKELVSINDFMYVKPEYRSTTVFNDMVEVMENELTKLGAKFRMVAFKTKEKKVNKQGYVHVENNYLKLLGDQ